MFKMLHAALAAFSCAALGQVLVAQQPTGSVETPTLPISAAPRPVFQEVPVFSAAAGFTYLQTNLTGVNGGSTGYVLGWYGIPEVHFTKHVSVLGDFTNFYNYHAHTEENVRGFTGGPVYALSPLLGITAYGFVEGGAVRDSKLGAVSWNAATVGGVGLNFKLTHALAFQVIPGEYVATHLPTATGRATTPQKQASYLHLFE